MKEIITWLRELEKKACELYEGASEELAGSDRDFSAFLKRLADDEALHYHLMSSASEYLQSIGENPSSAIVLDEPTKELVEEPLRKCAGYLEEGVLDRKDVMECIARAEFSEWNDIFLYVINTLKERHKAFQHVAAQIQAHENRISSFVQSMEESTRPTTDVSKLPRIWDHTFLIVDDQPAITELFATVFGRYGKTDTASNGEEALKRVRSQYYNVIISDIDMPVLSGLDFARKAIDEDKTVARRILLCSGNVGQQVDRFCDEFRIRFVRKPVSLNDLKKEVADVLRETS